MIHYIPSFHGDINIEPTGKNTCLLRMSKLSTAEKMALDALEPIARKKSWYTGNEPLTERNNVLISAPMNDVAKVIAKAIKPGREIVSAIQFADGKMQEITESDYKDTPEPLKAPYRDPALPPTPTIALPSPTEVIEGVKITGTESLASVARPVLGCPEPDFAMACIRATRVLNAFLNPEQKEDWARYNRFITIGALTGHRYMITSRHARDTLANVHRSLYDLDDHRPFCVHDHSVEASEEVLALHILVQLTGHENYLRHMEN